MEEIMPKWKKWQDGLGLTALDYPMLAMVVCCLEQNP